MADKSRFLKWMPYLVAIVTFAVVAVGYFSPEVLEGKVLIQHDIKQAEGGAPDLGPHQKETGEKSLWASRMFGGMPTYQIHPFYANMPVLLQVRNAFELYLPSVSGHIFACFLGFFLLLIALGIGPWLSLLGGLMYGFSSYFMIIIGAGHIWKMWVLELIPATFAGVIWAYRGRFLLGGVVTALFFTLQLFSNHIQMTYYFCLVLLIYVIGRFVHDYRHKRLPCFFKASGVMIIAGMVALGANITNLYMSAKYAEQTIRGKSELTALDPSVQSKGLDKDYATQWSYGKGETFTLLIPDTKGGATGAIGNDKTALANVAPEFRADVAQSNRYWGDQPFTSGPVYVGAFVVFLFILSCFLVKGYMKWVLLIATLLSIGLSWGKNMMFLTDLFFDYFPLYNKFRTVSSILVIAELTIPLLAVLGLSKLVTDPSLWKRERRAVWISAVMTVGILLLFLILPDFFFNFISRQEQASYGGYAAEHPEAGAQIERYLANLSQARQDIFTADVWRSLIFVVVGTGFLQLYAMGKMKKGLLVALLSVLVVVDMAGVDKRYLNGSNFETRKEIKQFFAKTPADERILQDKDPNYRVFNLTVSPFNDASTSYFHKSIGGYHGAKLRRYQDLIERQLSRQNVGVINMLNTKYLIVPGPDGKPTAQYNPGALGHAWFVPEYRLVDNADQEMAALDNFDPGQVAIVDKRFAGQLTGLNIRPDSLASVTLTDYKINHLTYKTRTDSPQLAVFSEIYYNDGASSWQAYIDGKPAEHFRTDYVLRGMVIPAGEHTVEFVFKPQAFRICETISVVSMVILLIGVIAVAGLPWLRKRFKPSVCLE